MVDSSFLISLFTNKEERNARSVELWSGISETCVITDHILEETIDWLMNNCGSEFAYGVGRRILDNSRMKIVYADEQKVELGLEILKKYAGLSLCDSLSVLVMKENGISKILSYDSDFDRFRGIVRIH